MLRPADANESAIAWEVAIRERHRPVALLLTRHDVPVIDRSKLAAARELNKGAYILSEAEGGAPELVIIATGSEVGVALEAQTILASEGRKVRVVSMPSWELFEEQPAEYRRQVLPPEVAKRLVVEAGQALGWEKYAGPAGEVMGLTEFGKCGPWKQLAELYGFTPEKVAARARTLLERS